EFAPLQMADGSERAGGNRRGKRGGEDESGRVRADRVAAGAGCSDIAAHIAETLRQRPVDDIEAVHHAVALGDAAAARAIQADGVHLIEIGGAPYFSARSQISLIGAMWPS